MKPFTQEQTEVLSRMLERRLEDLQNKFPGLTSEEIVSEMKLAFHSEHLRQTMVSHCEIALRDKANMLKNE